MLENTVVKPRIFILAMVFLSGFAQTKPLYDVTPITQDVQQIVSGYGLDGASLKLFRDGSPVYYQHFGSYTASTRVSIASASKWLSALALARLVEKGQMSWEDTIGRYITNAPADKKDIRLRQLFSHTAGMNPGEDDCLSNRFITLENCTNQILAEPLAYIPGTTFAYGGNSMQVAGRMAEIATGKTWDQLFIDEMVIPLGLQNTDYAAGSQQAGYVRVNNARIAGGVRSTVDDYGIVLVMIQKEGLHQGVRFLNKATLDYMATDQAAGLVVDSSPFEESLGYGIGQWREEVDFTGVATRVSSPGAFAATPWVDKRNRVAGFFFVKDSGPRLQDELRDLRDLVAAVFSTKYRIPPPQQPKPTSVPNNKQAGSRR
jgi:CubicO group peptidase (beta-lactamase class C family)